MRDAVLPSQALPARPRRLQRHRARVDVDDLPARAAQLEQPDRAQESGSSGSGQFFKSVTTTAALIVITDPAVRTLARIHDGLVVSAELSWDGTPCVVWARHLDSQGYGIVTDSRKSCSRVVHRVRWELEVGAVPDGYELDHLCRRRSCASLAHLEVVTHIVNIRRGEAGLHMSTRTHCPAGHEYDGVNTRHLPDGSRECVECRRAHKRRRRAGGPGKGGLRRARTHCKNGHEFTAENTIVRPNPENGGHLPPMPHLSSCAGRGPAGA